MHKLGAALFASTLAVPARAQSINVDFEPSNTPYGLPTPNYAGSTGVPGVWNSVSAVAVTSLRRWDGAVTGVSLTISDASSGCGQNDAFNWENVPDTSGQTEALLDDCYNPQGGPGSTLQFQGLAPGEYFVDTISRRLCDNTRLLVEVSGSPDPPTLVDGTWFGAYVEGENFARHAITVTDGTIMIHVAPQHFTSYQEVSAIQLHFGEQELPGSALCFGDGVGTACPCANSGQEGRGCGNSAGTGGAVLFATGTTSPDTVVLRSFGELPSALSIFFQGNASIPPVVFGDGLRCVGGTLRRLYTKAASSGEAVAPGPGDPSITARSAALGVPIPPDGRRYYQVYYRDANEGFCPAPQGSTFNISGAVRINW